MHDVVSGERAQQLQASLERVRSQIQRAAAPDASPMLLAVSKYRPAADVLACLKVGQSDFGENYVQELVAKAAAVDAAVKAAAADDQYQLPSDVRWHFIGTLQSNKAKALASIPNLYAVQSVSSSNIATALQNALPPDRQSPLRVFLQVNTSGETSKSGLTPLEQALDSIDASDLIALSRHILTQCPRLRLEGLMTIGSRAESLSDPESRQNMDFLRLKETRDALEAYLTTKLTDVSPTNWGDKKSGRLSLSMGMSSDFEEALRAGSDVVRLGTGIFGERSK